MRRKKLRKRQVRQRPGWQTYQAGLRRTTRKKRVTRKMRRWGLILLFLGSLLYGITGRPLNSAVRHPDARIPDSIRIGGSPHLMSAPPDTIPEKVLQTAIRKDDLRALLSSETFVNLKDNSLCFDYDGRRFFIETTIDPLLQRFLLNRLNPRAARYIGMVVMEPETGRILSMVSFDSVNPGHNTCTDNRFPAASVFKIVTAAAAIEECGFRSDSPLTYAGRKHTLYKFQLEKSAKRPVNRITLRDSFAQSVNPVFGKLGVHWLEKEALEEYALAFGFKRKLGFEVPVLPSRFSLSDEPYQWAEVASGFNRTTTLSPLHGALMASAIASGKGCRVEPAIVDRITDEHGTLIYRNRGRRQEPEQAIAPRTAQVLRTLMVETVRSGTGRKAFRGYHKDPVLSKLRIGGKTGSINSRSHDYRRFDWFVGFAEEKRGGKKIALSIVVAHENYIGVKAGQYARLAIREYFRNCFLKQETATRSQNGQKRG